MGDNLRRIIYDGHDKAIKTGPEEIHDSTYEIDFTAS